MKTQDAIKAAGGAKALADALGVWPQAVYKWGEDVPSSRLAQVQQAIAETRKNAS